ncbi:MAG: DNA polymerase domain-containing protein [Thermoproteota archaeon]
MTAVGWLFDIYPLEDRMVFWIKQWDGSTVRLEDSWTPSIYVATDDRTIFKAILEDAAAMQFVKDHDFVSRQEKVTDLDRTIVLKLVLSDSAKGPATARRIERLGRFGEFRLYNVDVPPAQSYLYQHDLFSMAYCGAHPKNSNLIWELQDDVWDTKYKLHDFKKIYLGVKVQKKGGLPKFTDRIDTVVIKDGNDTYEISNISEADLLADLESTVTRLDPDFVFTQDGDTFLFPYLISRAEQNGTRISLSRDCIPLIHPAKEGTSYFSYGKIHFKPTATRIYGRVHIDLHNSFIWDEAAMQGIYEIARICRMPLHTAARASIGRCMSSLQFYHATKKGILIPWKPTLAEHFKTYQELLVADRGGFVFEPEIGVHEKVAEFDFASLYANIMMKKNLSAETVRCECCPDSKKRVPELDYNICERRLGIVPISLKILIEKRAEYKKLRNAEKDPVQKRIYDERQNALKWILVTSFGYLGFNNAKFGRIDAHIAVCAFDRHVFLQASRIAERLGFRVLHGIVDSFWLQKRNVTRNDYLELKDTIERETGFEISFEGIYKWIAFVHSKESNKLPVANRYFGAFEDGSLKIRGIEARRHDTPQLFRKFQVEVLKIMAGGDTIAEVKALMPQVQDVFDKYAQLLRDGQVPMDELVFVKNVSKDADQHSERNTIENDALSRLAKEGKMLKAGQTLRYVISGYGKKARRATPLELVNERTAFDPGRYIQLLAQTCNSVTEPFGYVVQANDY